MRECLHATLVKRALIQGSVLTCHFDQGGSYSGESAYMLLWLMLCFFKRVCLQATLVGGTYSVEGACMLLWPRQCLLRGGCLSEHGNMV